MIIMGQRTISLYQSLNEMKLLLTSLSLLLLFNVASAITDGTNAAPGEFPYFVSLRDGADNWRNHWCGGTIVDEEWVITDAWCCDDPDRFYHVAAGVNDVHNVINEQHYDVIGKYKHPDYNASFPWYNNLCMVHIDGNFTWNAYVQPVTLTADSTNIDTAGGGLIVTSVGLGATAESPAVLAETVQKVDLKVIDHQECNIDYVGSISQKQVCCGDLIDGGDKGSCYADDGGPTVLQGTNELVAMFVYSRGCADNPDSSPYGIYTEMAFYGQWVNDVIANGGL